MPAIFDLLHRTVQDEERTELVFQKAMGLIGDLAEAFPGGEIRDQLLSDWIISNLLKAKPRGQSAEAKRTIKWAKEVRVLWIGCNTVLSRFFRRWCGRQLKAQRRTSLHNGCQGCILSLLT